MHPTTHTRCARCVQVIVLHQISGTNDFPDLRTWGSSQSAADGFLVGGQPVALEILAQLRLEQLARRCSSTQHKREDTQCNAIVHCGVQNEINKAKLHQDMSATKHTAIQEGHSEQTNVSTTAQHNARARHSH